MKKLYSLIFFYFAVASLFSQTEILNENISPFKHDLLYSQDNYGRSDIENALNDVFDIITSASSISGFNAAILLPDGTQWTRATGWAKDTIEEMRTDHHMGMGSITKTFVAATVMKMEEEGLLSINDAIGKYISPSPNIDTSVTISQLLNHTTGFNDYLNENQSTIMVWSENVDSIWHMDTILNNYVLQPNFEPGFMWSYSNTNYLLAGKVIESITGKPWYEATRQYIIDPLELEYTYSAPWENKYEDLLAHPFGDINGDGMPTDVTNVITTMDGIFSLASSAGNLVSTPTDLNRGIKGIFDGTLLSENSLDKMKVDYLNSPGSGITYGLGTLSFDLGQENYGHNGSIIHQSTSLYFPELDIAISCQQNEARIGFSFVDINDLLENLLNTYLNCLETSSAQDFTTNEFKVFPNPTSEVLNIQIGDGSQYEGIGKIYNSFGWLTKEFEVKKGETQIDISGLKEGIYFLNTENHTRQFIKM